MWYGENERVIATTVGAACQPLGVAIGFVFPTFFVVAADSLAANKDEARTHIFQSILWQAVIASVVFILVLIFFKEKPPTPPSTSASTEDNSEGICTLIKKCMS